MHDGRSEPLPEPVARPVCIVVSGLPGTGKSHLCRRLAERLSLAVLESDALRKSLFPTPTYERAESERVFEALHRLLQETLLKGIPAIVDATNLAPGDREQLYRVARRTDTPLFLVRVDAPPEVVQERLEQRTRGLDPENRSDADWQVYQRMRRNTTRPRENHLAVDTGRDIEPAVAKIVRAARRAMRATG